MDGESLRHELSKLRKRRGVVRASITRLDNRLKELEDIADQPGTPDHARQLAAKLEVLDSELKAYHFQLIDLLDDEDAESLEKEQDVLDKHDDIVAELKVRIERLCSKAAPAATNNHRLLSRKLSHLEESTFNLPNTVTSLPEDVDDISLLQQYEEQVSDYKKELAEVNAKLLMLDDEEEVRSLFTSHSKLEKTLFECSHVIRKFINSRGPGTKSAPAPVTDSTSTVVKLPKLEVPTFDGNLLNWKQFWGQFCASVHDRTSLSDAEKLVYLQNALKDGSAKNAIEGLSRSGEHYAEAIGCLKSRYDRPRLIHQTHVKMILETPPLREGNGKELRRLHDTVQQHLRALRSMDYEPSAPFITSLLELKLDATTMFEWQPHTQPQVKVPHFQDLLDFIDGRAQASESFASLKKPSKGETSNLKKSFSTFKPVTSFTTSHESANQCVLCKPEKHPLYACPKFKSLSHERKLSTIKVHNICINCLTKGHFAVNCKSLHRCRKCQKPHHTLLHTEAQQRSEPFTPSLTQDVSSNQVSSNAAVKLKSNSLLMTCRISVIAPDGASVEARALLDNGSSASFISERLVQSIRLPCAKQSMNISGFGGLSPIYPTKSIANFKIAPTSSAERSMDVTAIVVPKVTCDLPTHPVPFNSKWDHLIDLTLADPEFGTPGRIDVLLGVDIFVEALCHGRRKGPSGSPIALETIFGWVICGKVESDIPQFSVAAHHALVESGDDILRKFWEIEESSTKNSDLSIEERTVLRHFELNHFRNKDGRFVVPLPKKSDAKPLGESRSQAVRRLLSLERSLNAKGRFAEFKAVMKEYVDLQHAEIVPVNDLEKPQHMVFYLPMHAVYKQSSSTTKVRAVFDASAKSSSDVSLNDVLLVGPTVHPPLVDVLLCFRLHRVALTADVSKMYRAIELTNDDKDLHRFVWRSNPNEPLKDYRMTRLTFGISASSFAANMAIKQNAIDLAHEYPRASEMVEESFYVDDCLTGADNNEDAIKLHYELQALLSRGGFHLRKWNSSESAVLENIDPDVRDSYEVLTISGSKEYAKTLGLEWNTTFDHFRLTISNLSPPEIITKRTLVSDIAKIFDVLGWFSPTVIKMKMLLQRLWELKIAWDDLVPTSIQEIWLQWISELPSLANCHVSRYYFPKNVTINSLQLHGFCDASENAYAGVVYLRGEDSEGRVYVSLVTAKTRVSPIKRLTIPRLELCGAHLLTQVLHHVKEVYKMPLSNVFAWTDSTIVLNWLSGTPKRFKTYVGNRVSYIVDCIPPNHWKHVNGIENPADCASRGLFPSELVNNELWWKGPKWLYSETSKWPGQEKIPRVEVSEEEREISLVTTYQLVMPVMPLNRYSTFSRLQRVTAWIYRFINNCRVGRNSTTYHPHLAVAELSRAENYWLSYSQLESFPSEIASLKSNHKLPSNSKLISLNPFIDSSRIMRVGGRLGNSKLPYSRLHPIVLHAKHPITKLIMRSEHIRLLHAGPTLMISSLCLRFHIINLRKAVRSITRQCVICRRHVGETLTQLRGQLPSERVTPGTVFETVGVDYAGPVHIKYGYVRKPTIVKAYVCVFVSLTVKAVHLELVSDLTSEAFIAALRRFVARRGYPHLIYSDHGTNFVGANRELKELFGFLKTEINQRKISEFCASRSIEWKFIPERAPHFGGLWEAAVKSMKTHLRRVITPDVKLTFEEMTTVLVQIEACLNSRPLIPVNFVNDCVTDVLTPGHFLIGQSLTTLPDNSSSSTSLPLKHRWHLCQNLIHHFWKRWSTDYLTTLNKFYKWSHPTRNVSIGDIVILRDEVLFPSKWPIARVIDVHCGNDNLVRVVTLKTAKGIYKRPIHKIVLLVPVDSEEL